MSTEFLLGIDIGTSGCKITAFDVQGQVIATDSQTYETYYPHPGWVEQDPLEWWTSVCQGIHTVLQKGGIVPGEIGAIGVDGQSWSCLPLDRNGVPLHRAMIWLDRRAVTEAGWMKKTLGEDVLINLSGNPVDPAYIAPKMLWLKREKPEAYRRAHRFVQSNAYMVFKLTGRYSQDYSQGYGFHFFDISRGAWDEKTAEKLGISLDLMSPLVECQQVVGTVTPQAARETGLKKGTPVVAGGLDAACCTLGAGVIQPGQTQEQGGQAGGMSIQVDRPLIHPKLILGYHVLPGQWLLQGGTVGGGGTLRWFNDQMGAFEKQQAAERGTSSFDIMSEEAATVAPGSDGLIFLPYMAGERSPLWNSKARGVFFGLSYDKKRAHIIRAIMEGVGFSLLHNLETAAEVGARVDELVSVGGTANSHIWTQIKADITGKSIHVPYSDHATTLGAALLAGIGTGIYRDFEQAVQQTVRLQRTHTPDTDNHNFYQSYYNLYLELYERLVDCYDILYQLSSTPPAASTRRS